MKKIYYKFNYVNFIFYVLDVRVLCSSYLFSLFFKLLGSN